MKEFLRFALLLILGIVIESESAKIQNPTFFSCSEKTIFSWSPYRCLFDCGDDFSITSDVAITLFGNSAHDKLLYGSCKKIMRRTLLSEDFWFTRFPPIITYETKLPNYLECLSSWDRNCRRSECLVNEPPIPSGYSWNQDRIIDEEYYILDIHRSTSILKIEDKKVILTHDGECDFDPMHCSIGDNNVMYIWEPDSQASGCTMDGYKSLDCKVLKDGDILCPEIGISLSRASKLREVCGLKLNYDHGIFFSRDSFLPGINKIEESTDNDKFELIHRSLRTNIDEIHSRLCMDECQQLSTRGNGEVFSIGGRLIKKIKEDNYLNCRYRSDCKIDFPIIACGEDRKIKVKCKGASYWWNHKNSFELDNTMCDNHNNSTPLEEIDIMIGSDIIKINDTGLHWYKASREMTNLRVISNDIIEIPISDQKLQWHINATKTNAVRVEDISSSRLGHIWKGLSEMWENLLLGSYKIIIMIICLFIVLFLSYKFIFKTSRNAPPAEVQNQVYLEVPVTEYHN
nr:TPA_asm: G [Cucurbita betacytorhabdovirus 1]